MSLTTDSSERREARWPITLGGLYYGVLPKASHGELCPSPFVVIDLEPAPTQRAGIYQRAVSGFLHGIALVGDITRQRGDYI